MPRKTDIGWSPSLVVASALIILTASPTSGAPSEYVYIAVEGTITDMWLGEDRCWFTIEVDWSNHSSVNGRSIDCRILFLNDSTGMYDWIRSSQGWQIGDHLNSTGALQWDENSEWYFLYVASKSDLNFASEPQHDNSTLLAISIALLALVVILTILVWIRKRPR